MTEKEDDYTGMRAMPKDFPLKFIEKTDAERLAEFKAALREATIRESEYQREIKQLKSGARIQAHLNKVATPHALSNGLSWDQVEELIRGIIQDLEPQTQYALVVKGKRVVGDRDNEMTKEGQEFLVTLDSEGWVEATSTSWRGEIPLNVKAFSTEQEAIKFAQRWTGHPWWCKPNGDYRVIPIQPLYEKISGWRIVDP